MIPMFLVARVLAPRIGRPYISNRGTPAHSRHLITDLRKEKQLVGLAAMVMVDGQGCGLGRRRRAEDRQRRAA